MLSAHYPRATYNLPNGPHTTMQSYGKPIYHQKHLSEHNNIFYFAFWLSQECKL